MLKIQVKTTIITPTYNKSEYLKQAIDTVLSQTDKNWEWWIVLDGPDNATQAVAENAAKLHKKIKIFLEPTKEHERKKIYRPAAIINKYYPLVKSKYIAWLSDDDLLEPIFLEKLAGALDKNPSWDVVYGSLECVKSYSPSQPNHHWFWIHADRTIGKGTGITPDCRIDGGQIIHTKRSYDATKPMLDTSYNQASHADGILMQILANHYRFYPINVKVVSHRSTPISTWRKP